MRTDTDTRRGRCRETALQLLTCQRSAFHHSNYLTASDTGRHRARKKVRSLFSKSSGSYVTHAELKVRKHESCCWIKYRCLGRCLQDSVVHNEPPHSRKGLIATNWASDLALWWCCGNTDQAALICTIVVITWAFCNLAAKITLVRLMRWGNKDVILGWQDAPSPFSCHIVYKSDHLYWINCRLSGWCSSSCSLFLFICWVFLFWPPCQTAALCFVLHLTGSASVCVWVCLCAANAFAWEWDIFTLHCHTYTLHMCISGSFNICFNKNRHYIQTV